MTRRTFNKVCRVLEPDLSPIENTVRAKTSSTHDLYWFATRYRTIGKLFGVAKSTALKRIHRVCEALVENHMQEFVTFPKGTLRPPIAFY